MNTNWRIDRTQRHRVWRSAAGASTLGLLGASLHAQTPRQLEDVKLTASEGAALDGFGVSVAVGGDVALVGAPFDAAAPSSGSAYIFRFDGTSWVQEQKLLASDAAAGEALLETRTGSQKRCAHQLRRMGHRAPARDQRGWFCRPSTVAWST